MIVFPAAISASTAAANLANRKAECLYFMEGYKHTSDVLNMQVYSACVDLLHPLQTSGGLTLYKAMIIGFLCIWCIAVVMSQLYANMGERLSNLFIASWMSVVAYIGLCVFAFLIQLIYSW